MLKLIEKKQGNIAVVSGIERLNISNVHDFKETLESVITQKRVKLVLDLEQTRFIDCCAVSCILSLMQLAQKNDSSIKICNLSENVKLLIETLHLSSILNIEDNVDSCIQKFS